MRHYEFSPETLAKNQPVEISEDELTVLRAMYHAARREWPEWLGNELARKTGLPPRIVTNCLTTLSYRGLVRTRPGPKKMGGVAAWRATTRGQELKP